MAFTNLKNVVVTKAFNGGLGFAVEERFKKNDGSDGKTKWKLWFEEGPGLAEGQAINVSGIHSDKVDTFENADGDTVHYVERSLNKARLSDEQPDQADAGEPF